MRLKHFRPEELDPEKRALYDAIAGGTRATSAAIVPVVDEMGRLLGPFNAMLHHPRLGTAIQEVGRLLRYEGVLTARCRELVILLVAHVARSEYEWNAHLRLGSAAGVSAAEADAVAASDDTLFSDPAERAAIELARTLLADLDVDDPTYGRLVAALGEAGVFEVSALTGYYRLLATQLSLFRAGR